MAIITAERRTDGCYNVLQVIEVIQQLAHSQGFYGRMLERILYMQAREPESFETFKNEVEAQNFKDPVDVVLYFET